MRKTTVYLPEDLKADLERAANESRRSEAELIREGIRMAIARLTPPTPRIGIFSSSDPHFAERIDEYMTGFGRD
jgi:metal-responsive CopG/Arc/MetJ family transcriptional regulator